MKPPLSFRTERLLVRKVEPTDAADIFAYAHDPEVCRFLPWKPHQGLGETRAFLNHCREGWKHGTGFPYAVEHAETSTVIGMLEIRPVFFKVEFGYVLARAHWGQGYMTEALHPVIEWLKNQPQVLRIWAYHDVANPASGRVLQKLGLSLEGRLRNYMQPAAARVPSDCEMYAWVP